MMAISKKQKLTPKQEMFVQEYLVDLNAKKAALRAGYKNKTSNGYEVQGARLLSNAKVQAVIQKAQEKREARTGITQDRVLNELAKLAFSNITDVATWTAGGVVFNSSDELSPEHSASIAEISSQDTKEGVNLRIKQYDKKGALELLGKHLGLFIEKIELSGDISISSILDEARKRVE